jgi:hypothetical protein
VALALTPALAVAQESKLRDTPADKAVAKALEYLYESQSKSDGAWRLSGTKSPAATGLAVMAFLSAGHVPGEGKYGEAVAKGIRWVIKQQKGNGVIAGFHGHEMYHHGICTIMLAEAAGMVDGDLAKEVRTALEKAVKIILRAQRTAGEARGGWRYNVDSFDADMSVTGWQVMALRAAKNVGCDVPPAAIQNAVDYIKRSQDPRTGGFAYMPGHGYTVACTGTGILALELCGKDMHKSPEVLRAGACLIKREHEPNWADTYFFYTIYYCSQATFQLGDNYWNTYGPKMKRVLLANQQPNGSWGAGNGDSGNGEDYCTSMAVLALTVEYRFLPIYQREEPRDQKK